LISIHVGGCLAADGSIRSIRCTSTKLSTKQVRVRVHSILAKNLRQSEAIRSSPVAAELLPQLNQCRVQNWKWLAVALQLATVHIQAAQTEAKDMNDFCVSTLSFMRNYQTYL